MPLSVRPLLAPLTLVSGLLTVWTLAYGELVGAPIAVVFVIAAFAWHLTRSDPFAVPAALPTAGCTGCRAGCAGCRERIG